MEPLVRSYNLNQKGSAKKVKSDGCPETMRNYW